MQTTKVKDLETSKLRITESIHNEVKLKKVRLCIWMAMEVEILRVASVRVKNPQKGIRRKSFP